MKHYHVFVITMICMLFACNSSYDINADPQRTKNRIEAEKLETTTHTKQASFSYLYSVSEDDAIKFAKAVHPQMNYQIAPYVSDKDTLLYLINYDSGWLILAGDKRINPFVAESGHGQFSFDTTNENLKVWIDSYADEIRVIKNDDREEDNEYTKLWANISHQHNGGIKPKTRNGEEYKWAVITYIYCDTMYYNTSISHLVSTKWGQFGPWYNKLPTDASANNGRCLTGCTAVSLSQMIHYMHYHLGKPTGLYHTINISKSTISGKTSDIGFSRSDYTPVSSRWDAMATDSTTGNVEYVQNLMLDVGNRLNMKYSGYGSFANPSTSAMSYYNLTYSQSAYNFQNVLNDLQNSKPVLVSARYYQPSTGTYPGHTWLIDGLVVKISHYTMVKHFEYTENWMYETEYYDSFDDLRRIYNINSEYDIIELDGGTTTTNYLLMNWGYDGYGDDDYFSSYPSDAWNYGFDYNYDKTIYYNFR